jgi:hypothetical protein
MEMNWNVLDKFRILLFAIYINRIDVHLRIMLSSQEIKEDIKNSYYFKPAHYHISYKDRF